MSQSLADRHTRKYKWWHFAIVMLFVVYLNGRFGWHQTNEERRLHLEAKLQSEKMEAELRQIDESRRKANSESKERKAASRSYYHFLQGQGERTLLNLEAHETERESLQVRITSLLTDDDGRNIASDQAFLIVFERLMKEQKDIHSVLSNRKEALSPLMASVRQSLSEENELNPDVTIIAQFEKCFSESERSLTEIRRVRDELDELALQARNKNSPADLSLEETLKRWHQKRLEVQLREVAELVEKSRVQAVAELASIEKKKVEAETLAKAKELEATREAALVRAKADEDKIKRIALCKSPETLELLAPFVSKGFWQPGMKVVSGGRASDWKPVSLGLLHQHGALQKSNDGLQTLLFCGTSFHHFAPYDRNRPRWSWPNKLPRLSPGQRERLERTQAFLIEHGALLVEIGLLSP